MPGTSAAPSLFALNAPDGTYAEILSTGASLRRFAINGPSGLTDVVLSLPGPEDYVSNPLFVGCVVGRVANRIADARIEIDGHRFDLPANEGSNTLHGGPDHFGIRDWEVVRANAYEVLLRLVSPDGDQGFPGELEVRAAYRIGPRSLSFEAIARTTKPTLVNLTHHAYWNLSGGADADVRKHRLWIDDGYFSAPNPDKTLTVCSDPMFANRFCFCQRIGLEDLPLEDLDLNLVLGDPHGLREVAHLEHPESGLRMRMLTESPCVQVYGGGALDQIPGRPFDPFAGICLEPQRRPYIAELASGGLPILRPGEIDRYFVEWRFDALES